MKFVHEGIFTTGYYNDMEAGFPVFIDGECIDELFKAWLKQQGIGNNFCFNTERPERNEDWSHRATDRFPYVGKRVRMTIELVDKEV